MISQRIEWLHWCLVVGALFVVIHAAVIIAPSVSDDEMPCPLCFVAEVINPPTELLELFAGYRIGVLNLVEPICL